MIDELKTVPEPPLSEAEPQKAEAEEKQQIPAQETVPDETETEAAEETEEAEEEQPQKPDYLTLTLESRVLPLEMRFSQINDCYKKTPFAFRSFTYVNSVIDGIIPPERYSFAADQSEEGIRLSRWNVKEAAAALKKLADEGKKVDFITARVSPKIVDQLDFYAYVKELADGCGAVDYSKLCLEFPRTVLFEDHEKVRAAVLALKLLKIKSMLSGCGESDSALTPLLDLPFDYVILAPSLSYRINDRGKKAAMEAFLSFIRLLGCDVIADNVTNDEQISALVRADCIGYIPSPDYKGTADHGRLRMPLDEVLLQSDGQEEF